MPDVGTVRFSVLPHEQGFEKLYDDDETQSDQYESEVEQQHETAHAFGVRAERIRRRHRFDSDARFARYLGLDRRHFGRGESVATVRVMTGRRSPASVAPARVMRSSAETKCQNNNYYTESEGPLLKPPWYDAVNDQKIIAIVLRFFVNRCLFAERVSTRITINLSHLISDGGLYAALVTYTSESWWLAADLARELLDGLSRLRDRLDLGVR